jgi:peptidyl-prolyl cis-trans isomerase B (cyclophilin B)
VGTEKRERQKQGRQARIEAALEAQHKAQRRRRLVTFAVVAVGLFGAMFLYSTFVADDDSSDDASSSDSTTSTTAPVDDPASAPFAYGDGECAPDTPPAEPVIDYDAAFQDCLDPDATYTAVFDTTEGEIRVDLDTENTPGTVNNFVNLARNGYYDGTDIFRTDTSIGILQGGSPHTNSASDPGPGYTIPDEGDGYTYEAGQLVMARSAGPDSGSAQFFLVANDAASALDAQGTYVVFGTTDDPGIDVVTSILDLNEDDPESGLGGAPSRTVTINSVTIEETPGSGDTTTTTAGGDSTTTTAG